MILNLIGPPPEEVLDRSSGSTKSWVKGQIEGLEEVPELHVGIGCDDPMAVSLLGSLLDFDSEKRLTAAEALDHIYLREFRDASTDPFDSRGKLHLQFDTADSSWAPEFWRELIETEIMEVATHIRGAPEAAAARPTSVQTMDLSDLDQVFTTAPIDQFVAASDLLTSHLEMEEDDTLRAAFGEVSPSFCVEVASAYGLLIEPPICPGCVAHGPGDGVKHTSHSPSCLPPCSTFTPPLSRPLRHRGSCLGASLLSHIHRAQHPIHQGSLVFSVIEA